MKEGKQTEVILLCIAGIIICYFLGWLILGFLATDNSKNVKTKILNRFLCGLIVLVIVALGGK